MTHLVLKLDFTGQSMVFESYPPSFSLKLKAQRSLWLLSGLLALDIRPLCSVYMRKVFLQHSRPLYGLFLNLKIFFQLSQNKFNLTNTYCVPGIQWMMRIQSEIIAAYAVVNPSSLLMEYACLTFNSFFHCTQFSIFLSWLYFILFFLHFILNT